MKFKSLEVHGVREVADDAVEVVYDDLDADFFSLYGRDERGFAHCIGDFTTRQAADEIKNALTTS
jgi:hypothetical protein